MWNWLTGRLASARAVRVARLVPAWAVDLALAAGLAAAMIAERVAAPLPGNRQSLAIALSLVIAAALALRRRLPLAAYLAGSAALVAGALWAVPSAVAPYANLIGVYSLGLYARRSRAWCGPFLVVPAVLVYFARTEPTAPVSGPTGVLLAWLLARAVGYGSARRREEQRAARAAMRRQAVADERARLARELHDLVGHTVNVMVVQAGAARLVLDRDPAKTSELLTSLELTGRQALGELDHMLGVLRDDRPAGGGDGLTMPGIADLPGLAERMTEAGVRVTVHLDPPSPRLSRGVDLSAYRIIQEALTNSMKHGGARSASVTVRLDGPWLGIEVCDDGRGAAAGYLPGRGLLGVGERVAAFGGSLQHGSGDRGGFRLRATLPAP